MAGPLIGIFVPVLLLVGNRTLGISSNFIGGPAIAGLADLRFASLIAVVAFFAGGLFMMFVVLPVIL